MTKYISIFAIVLSFMTGCRSGHTVNIEPGQKDYTAVVSEVLESSPSGNLTIRFAEGTYDFFPENAEKMYLAVSNNDNGEKKVAFVIDGMKNVIIEGNGTEFLFHGEIVPFFINSSENVTLKGFSIDYDVPFVFEGKVLSADEKTRSIEVKTDARVGIRNGELHFSGYDWEKKLSGQNIVFDEKNMKPYYNTAEYLHRFWESDLKAEKAGDGIYRLSGWACSKLPPVGSYYVDKGTDPERTCPGISVHGSRNLLLEDVTVYCAGAMALICENTENVTMKCYDVCLKEGSPRVISSSADASHFVNCSGLISFDSCLFENMMDDGTNVHGVYMPVARKTDYGSLVVSFGHYQQDGFEFAHTGNRIRLVSRNTLQFLGEFVLDSIAVLNGKEIELFGDIPETDELFAVENAKKAADVIMKGCTVRNNRARSVLISTPGKVMIEDNYFEPMMAGVLISGDANKWFESGAVNYVTVRRNEFVNIGHGGENPQSALQISPQIPPEARDEDRCYHGRIVFEDNLIRTYDSQVIYALSVDNLIVRNNKFVHTGDFEPIFPGLTYIDLQYCNKVEVSGNTFEGGDEVEVSAIRCNDVRMESGQEGFCDEVVDKPNGYYYQQ